MSHCWITNQLSPLSILYASSAPPAVQSHSALRDFKMQAVHHHLTSSWRTTFPTPINHTLLNATFLLAGVSSSTPYSFPVCSRTCLVCPTCGRTVSLLSFCTSMSLDVVQGKINSEWLQKQEVVHHHKGFKNKNTNYQIYSNVFNLTVPVLEIFQQRTIPTLILC